MRNVFLVTALLVTVGLAPDVSRASTSVPAGDPSVAALQVALKARGHYAAAVDGLDGPQTQAALAALRRTAGIRERRVGPHTRRALGGLGRPLLGQRELIVRSKGWDVSSLEFRLRRAGLRPGKLDGVFDGATLRAVRAFQRRHGLVPDGIVGRDTFRVLARGAAGQRAPQTRRPHLVVVVQPGDGFYSIAERYGVSPLRLAALNRLKLTSIIVPGQRLKLPRGAHLGGEARATTAERVSRDAVRASLDRWSATYGVDPRLSRAVAWMESGYQQHVVSDVGAIGVMQLLPETWEWMDLLIGVTTPRTYDGNIRAGVRYLRWLLDSFNGNTRLALAGYYQGARAVREHGVYRDTKRYVSVIMQLYGQV